MDYGLVNAFLAAQDLSESEGMLRQNVVGLNDLVQKLTQERSTEIGRASCRERV